MRTFWFRLTSALVAAGCGLVLWQLYGLATQIGGTPFILAASIAVGSVSAAAFGLTIADSSIWERIVQRSTSFVVRLRTTPLPVDRHVGRWLTAGGVGMFLMLAGWQLSQPDDISDDDQFAFLKTAQEAENAGGPPGLVRDLYSGRFREANRHPLYIGLLSLRPTEAFGRRLSFTIGLTTLVLLTWLVGRLRGPLVAGVFCLLLGTNGSFCLFSTVVVCDVLMVLWGGLAYLLVSERIVGTRNYAILLGVVLGLAYLTKGTGLLLWIGYIGWLIIIGVVVFRSGSRRSKSAKKDQLSSIANPQIVCLAWIIVVSPLLVRNLQVGEALFHNVNSYLLFVDEYEDPVKISEEHSVAEAAREYLQTHTIGDMIQREASGLVWESFILLRILGPAPFDDSRILFGLPLLVCAVVAVVADPRREHLLLSVWIAICIPMFAWYIPVAAGDRFPLPLLAPLLALSAEGIVRLTARGFATTPSTDVTTATPPATRP